VRSWSICFSQPVSGLRIEQPTLDLRRLPATTTTTSTEPSPTYAVVVTLQEPEQLTYEGREVELLGTPLEPYLDSLSWPPLFRSRSSACHRGYEGTWDIDGDGVLRLTAIKGEVQDRQPVPSPSGWLGLATLGSRGRARLSSQAGFIEPPLPEGIEVRPAANGARSFFTIDDGRFVVSVPPQHVSAMQSIEDLIVHIGPRSWSDDAWEHLEHGVLRSVPIADVTWIDSTVMIPTWDPWLVWLDLRDIGVGVEELCWVNLEVNLESTAELPRDLDKFHCACLARIHDRATAQLPLGDIPCFQAAKERPLVLGDVFPERDLPIEADWFTGTLRTGEGGYDLIRRAGFAIRYEDEMILRLESGRVVDVRSQHNDVPRPAIDRRVTDQ